MVYIKKLVMKGFKSFAPQTEVPFINGMNSVVGPNGSGKSNITDAICFVLGRLSIKSMRAAKSANLIFAGTKEHKPSSEASVKLFFDNSDKKFSLPDNEIIIERIVRANGQGIYKINNEVKTRQEVLDLLAVAGIDPYGFNIVLQGEISSFVKMQAEERRKVLEEVAGISIYELRKEKSLREMEKTEERLKEISSILRERTAYLRNLEEERKQALKAKKLEETLKRCKASILKKKIDDKKKELGLIEEKNKEKEKEKVNFKEKIGKEEAKTFQLDSEISQINAIIQKASGIEQETLNNEISDFRASLAGLNVQKENNESRILELHQRKTNLSSEVRRFEEQILSLRKEFPSQAKKHQELEAKKKEFSELELQRKSFYNIREKLNAMKQIAEDKSSQIAKNKNNVSFILEEINKLALSLSYKDVDLCKKDIQKIKQEQELIIKNINKAEKEIIEKEKKLVEANLEISNTEKIKKQVSSIDICPLCKSKITPEHIREVFREADEKIAVFRSKINSLDVEKEKKELISLNDALSSLKPKLSKAELDLIKLINVEDKKEQLKKLHEEKSFIESQLSSFEKEKVSLEKKLLEFRDIEDRYDRVFLELREISSRSQENLNSELEFKERDLEKTKMIIKQNERDILNLEESLAEILNEISRSESDLQKKENEEKQLEARFQKLIEKKNSLDNQKQDINTGIYEIKNKLAVAENEVNNLKIELARLNAELENLSTDFLVFKDVEILSMSLSLLEEKLAETQAELLAVGSVNMRALEVYDKMKQEYEEIAKKVSTLEAEKLEIMKIIEEIDKKKKRTFMKTLYALNELFNRNFTQLSVKGQVSLELENPEEPFSAGLDIVVKVGKGKYFDVTSLSGGEQTLVALSLIFAIQEYKPYAFYIFDEVDAALDKRNSERLASLIKKYMNSGQYIIVTHNDSIITESSVLYGVSMQEGISKILSLQI